MAGAEACEPPGPAAGDGDIAHRDVGCGDVFAGRVRATPGEEGIPQPLRSDTAR
jgi:hypothetical protein